VRWESLFADLEGQLERAEALDLAAEVEDRTRRERARLRLVDRLRPAVGRPLGLAVHGAGRLSGALRAVGPDWLLLEEEAGREVLVPTAQVLGVQGLTGQSAEPGSEGRVAARLDLRSALRGLVRDRAPVQVVLLDGRGLSGTLDRVGQDYCELAVHAPGEPRRATAVRGVETLPLAALSFVRRVADRG
jgi:hypothetical protein